MNGYDFVLSKDRSVQNLVAVQIGYKLATIEHGILCHMALLGVVNI